MGKFGQCLTVFCQQHDNGGVLQFGGEGGTFYTPPQDSGEVLWFQVGRPCLCLSVVRLSVRPPVFGFRGDNLSKRQWIFTKLGMCIDIVEIWFGIANGQISSNFDGVICPRHARISFSDDN